MMEQGHGREGEDWVKSPVGGLALTDAYFLNRIPGS